MSETAQTPFHDLDHYVAVPRLTGLTAGPDGSRLVVTVQTLDGERTAYRTALWEVDPAGEAPARRLTRSAKGESSATFTRSGDLLFTSARPDPDGKDGDDPVPALWLLPARGGEAHVVATAPGGVSGPLAARAADVVSVAAQVLPSAKDLTQDATLRTARKDQKVSAVLHAGYPVRYWDQDLGPDQVRRLTGDLTALADQPASPLPAPADGERPGATPDPRLLDLRDLTGPGRQLDEHTADLSADGATLVTTWAVPDAGAARRGTVVAVDTATGDRRILVDDPDADAGAPRISPDGAWVAYLTESISTPEQAPVTRLGLVPTDGSADPVVLADDWDRWPGRPTWLPDGSGLLVQADDDGRGPVFLLTFAGELPGSDVVVERVTSDDAVFSDLSVTPDGATVFALRSSYAAPAEPVRIDLGAFVASGAAGERTPVAATLLRSPVPAPALPGTLTEVETTAADGARVRAWLALPPDAGPDAPAPLLLWIHGGPLGSWNAWSWRWNPWLMVAQGYAVLLPDPALSTGYGQEFVQRGWGAWGRAPFTDLMAITDAAEALPEIDGTRTAAMGGSFGGYMANWVAGHTDRFQAVVTHASLWALDQFGPTTDAGYYWAREMTPERALENSPHLSVGEIRTPMLVIHGDKDYRVPVGEGLRLWFELLTKSGLPASDDGETAHRFLYFPDENHWVLSPQNAKVWYQVVSAFLAERVLGETPELPATLG
ncbi:prolyl oligopeptidase family serine peptidase [Promicromonospora thailandica]|uniref:Dipeptidyl aminopeptidase/acylaminoacyl peptidase n=1 Tax=Promicromonospora thailandica TaxID=765201 RepID=A0A9X2JYG5_9MICO|nr:prolyl oligopeptidase family serine peptidase [Promicromonospora thailandica]MCP2265054.1 Dipeptidyl aminopeptidase/acylaminoacyl peptidase [Promicromonospora thailandica]BFF19892.1 S9 family peptidase [Promicromonospora thailandica]